MGQYQEIEIEKNLQDLKSRAKRGHAFGYLKGTLKELNENTLKTFIEQVSKSELDDYSVPLLQELVVHHKKDIARYVDSIIQIIISVLSTQPLADGINPGKLQEACANVIDAIVRHVFDPSDIHELYNKICCPFMSLLTKDPLSLAAGAAACIQPVVLSDKWKLADEGDVYELCSKVASIYDENLGRSEFHVRLGRAVARANLKSFGQFHFPFVESSKNMLRDAEQGPPKIAAVKFVNSVLMSGLNWESEFPSSDLSRALSALLLVLKCHEKDDEPTVRDGVQKATHFVEALLAGDKEALASISEAYKGDKQNTYGMRESISQAFPPSIEAKTRPSFSSFRKRSSSSKPSEDLQQINEKRSRDESKNAAVKDDEAITAAGSKLIEEEPISEDEAGHLKASKVVETKDMSDEVASKEGRKGMPSRGMNISELQTNADTQLRLKKATRRELISEEEVRQRLEDVLRMGCECPCARSRGVLQICHLQVQHFFVDVLRTGYLNVKHAFLYLWTRFVNTPHYLGSVLCFRLLTSRLHAIISLAVHLYHWLVIYPYRLMISLLTSFYHCLALYPFSRLVSYPFTCLCYHLVVYPSRRALSLVVYLHQLVPRCRHVQDSILQLLKGPVFLWIIATIPFAIIAKACFRFEIPSLVPT